MKKIANKQFYCLLTGSILFSIGLLGYAFRTGFNVPDSYLLLNLLLGFWGILLGLWGRE